MATTYISRTQANGTSSQKFTVSCWVKRSQKGSTGALWGSGSSTTDGCDLFIQTNGELGFESWDTSENPKVITTRQLIDANAWYNIVLAVDTTQATASNRLKIYINGVQETVFGIAETYPPQNYNFMVSTTNDVMKFGVGGQYATSYFNGSMSYVAFVDGTAELPGIFGETDSTTGEWKIKTTITPSVAWGNNGFLILKNGNSLTDESSNSNNFTLAGGTLTNTEDCPDNNFATWNGLIGYTDTLTNGNTTVTRATGSWRSAIASLPLPSTGKFYWEVKLSTGTKARIGIADDSFDGSIDTQNRNLTSELGEQTNGISYGDNGNANINTSQTVGYGSAITTSNILGVAVDMTNMKLYYSVDGVFQNSGVPTSGSTGTGALSIPTTTGKYFPAVSMNASGYHVNFGNGTFGTTVVSSAGTAGSTPGVFEYDVPTGYEPLTTKGLNV